MGCVDAAIASLGGAVRHADTDGGLFMQAKIDRIRRIREDLNDLFHDLENDIQEEQE